MQNRISLEENKGMLFVFPTPINASFWMKDTYIDLSIGFFDENKRVVQIEKMSSFKIGQPLMLYQSKKPIKYAIEVNMGWFENHGIKVGDMLDFD